MSRKLHTQGQIHDTVILGHEEKTMSLPMKATYIDYAKETHMTDMNKAIIEEFRANEGKVGGHFENATLVLLHTTGAKSGLERINPLVCMPDGDRIIVVASKAGAPSNPDWYYNLVANPEVVVEYGTEEFKAKATVTAEPERTELYSKIVAKHDYFAEYEQKATRVIPVIALTHRP
jgi:deazaflavin-dependent oxidoreductase (nitroreductase family)